MARLESQTQLDPFVQTERILGMMNQSMMMMMMMIQGATRDRLPQSTHMLGCENPTMRQSLASLGQVNPSMPGIQPVQVQFRPVQFQPPVQYSVSVGG
jgi:hypothetical protein